MKEVVKIGLAGVSFTIAQDAFEILNAYINELREHYSSEQSCDEIVADILSSTYKCNFLGADNKQ